jgi:uncharacterized protein YecE (DUF72 family)
MVRAGACSWADRGLIADGRFYPRRTMSARQRLGWYSSKLPLAEITATYRFPPTPELAAQWAERTPHGFVFDVRAWSLLGGNPTFPDSLWADLQGEVPPARRDQRRLYSHYLADDVVEECWARFCHALQPLHRAGRLGAVIVPYPSWFTPRPEAWAELAALRRRLGGLTVAVELRSSKWWEGDACETTLGWLEDHGLALVCLDGPAGGPRAAPTVVAATADLAVVRFCGRRLVDGEAWTWPYRYSRAELAEWVSRVTDLASSARQVHLLMDNGWRSDAVDAAGTLLDLLAAATSP